MGSGKKNHTASKGRLRFPHAAYATCNPGWHVNQRRLQSYNTARRRPLTEAEAQRARQLHAEGNTYPQIGELMGISRHVMARALRAMGCKRPLKLPEAQRLKLSIANKAYMANDPRWPAHRQKLTAAQIARRFTLSDEEIRQVIAMRERGLNLAYIQDKLCVCYKVIIRELKARGLSPKRWHANRLALCEEEIKQVVALRKSGRTFDYIAEEVCVCRAVIRRELKARGIPTAHIRRLRAKRGKGFWALFGDDPEPAKVAL